MFYPFTVNTFTGSEWGLGDESESIFNPEELDARQWAKAAADGGMKGLILTCKHHDGSVYGQVNIQNIVLKIHHTKMEKETLSEKQRKHVRNMD